MCKVLCWALRIQLWEYSHGQNMMPACMKLEDERARKSVVRVAGRWSWCPVLIGRLDN